MYIKEKCMYKDGWTFTDRRSEDEQANWPFGDCIGCWWSPREGELGRMDGSGGGGGGRSRGDQEDGGKTALAQRKRVQWNYVNSAQLGHPCRCSDSGSEWSQHHSKQTHPCRSTSNINHFAGQRSSSSRGCVYKFIGLFWPRWDWHPNSRF